MRILLLLLIAASPIQGQDLIKAYDDENFAFQVKLVDEFIERFNNTDSTLIKKYLKEEYNLEVDRHDLIVSLFNFTDKNWDKALIANFLNDVLQTSQPPYLSFYDQNWYAKVVCLADYKAKPVSFELILSIEYDQESSTVNWAIRSLNSEDLGLCGNFDFSKLLPPNAHGNHFLELRRVFATPEKYYDSAQGADNLMNRLLRLSQQKELVFQGVKDVSYHFLQIDEWIFEVEEFERNEENSGWLISELIKAEASQKEEYLFKQLYIKP
ncbi:MAG: hypothetical protein ACFB15_06595 [Cyclobacteriaceae bacterium]